MASQKITSSNSPQKVIDKLTDGMYGVFGNLISKNNYELKNGELIVAIYEKYFYRNNSMAALVVTAAGNESGCTIDLVSTAASSGIFNISFGAEKDSVREAIDILEK